ncbi:MAG TPA: phytanoyl-CoA dioxygenase family protein [Xanthomonadales bacterium]|nr:phytanoyl-CoA dioxygenase family protein [Xanthomonadales bacterium]
MSPERVLNAQQVEQFHREGYLLVRGMYSAEEMVQIQAWTDEVANYPEEPGKTMMYFESSQTDGSRILSRIENFVPFHQGFSRMITARKMQQAVSDLLDEPAVLFKDKINFKLPGGDGFKEHQDVQAGWNEFADLHVTAMVAIDETNAENGSLEMLPGMHRQGLLGKMWAPLTGEDTENKSYVAVHCQPGDTVFFDSFAPHRSAPNHTDQARRVLYITYNKASEGDSRYKYYAEKRKNYPPDIERDPNKDYSFKV